ncbi:MAG: co-chaperone GroES [Candidatus Nanoarchaeia archaeon]|nr:co-chaperone GroES [Candidatus Nanoarchaeia archaeon]
MSIKPLGERILIKPIKTEERTKGGIYIPESAKENQKQGQVIEFGNSKTQEIGLKKGDIVIYGGYSHEEIEINKEKFIIVELKDVLARVEEN